MKDRFEIMTQEEKTRAIDSFYKEAGIKKPMGTRKKKRWISVAVVACIVLAFSFTPAGTSAWAKAREAFMGIGQFLGNSAEDDYVTVIDQTQKKGDITFTLNEVVASDYEMRFSVTVEKDDGEVIGYSRIEMADVYINGLQAYGTGNSEEEIKSYGAGSFGGKSDGDRGIYFLSVSYEYDMPLNPEIQASFYADGRHFNFKFTLDNSRFQQATKEVEINKVFDTPAGEIHIGKLIISPIDQNITVDCKDDIQLYCYLEGTDEKGDEVSFGGVFGTGMYGSRLNSDNTSYQLNYDVKSYTLQLKYHDVQKSKIIPVGEPFTIDIP